MDVPRALDQIAEIHQQIAKGEIYRGYRPVPVALSGIVGLAAALAARGWQGDRAPLAFVQYWAAVAAVAACLGFSEIAYNYVVHDSTSGRRRTRRVLGQFLPAMLAAAVLTLSLVHVSPAAVALLPGIWSMCFGVGIFSSRPYLPGRSGLVALYYVAAGTLLLWTADLRAPLNPWFVGATFGIGQLLAAAVLYWELERVDGTEL
jgi:hypothetical protein